MNIPTIIGELQPILGDYRSYRINVSDETGPKFSLECKISGSGISSLNVNNEDEALEMLKKYSIKTARDIYQNGTYQIGENILKDYPSEEN